MSEEIQGIPAEPAKPIKRIKPVEYLREAIMQGKEANKAYSLPLFLGSLTSQHEAILSTATVYAQLKQVEDDINSGKSNIAESVRNSLRVKFDELQEQHFPGVDQDELGAMLISYFQFYQRGLDRVLSREDNQEFIDPTALVNTIPHRESRIGIINPIKPQVKAKDSVRDRMRRSKLKLANEPDTFSVMLVNSRIFLKMKVPTPLDMVLLINKITLELKGYGERYRVSSMHLERALITRILVSFMLERATYWSVADILDAEELFNIIKFEDVGIIATTLLANAAPKGVSYTVSCLADKCDYNETNLIDPANLVVYDDIRLPQVYKDQISEILNTGKKFTIDELKASDVPYSDFEGNLIDTVVKHDNGAGELHIKSPYLSDYFTCFDNMAEQINPELRELAVQFPNQKVYATKRAEVMGSIRMAEYLQWFDKAVTLPEPGEEGDPEVIHRHEDPKGFDQGLLDMFNSDDTLLRDALDRVIKSVPKMTYVYIGIPDDHCPKCKTKANDVVKEINGGFTPIDPILNFFDHTRMLIAMRRDLVTLQEEILS